MDFNEIMSVALAVIYVVVWLALLCLIVEIIRFVRRTRRKTDELHHQIEPTLLRLENITTSLEPTAKKIDPLFDRVLLTVDAANLEIMRLDQILENVSDITDSASSAVSAVDSIASTSMELVNNVTDKVRGVLKGQRASDESVALGQKKAEEAREELQGYFTYEDVSLGDGASNVKTAVDSTAEKADLPKQEAADEALKAESLYDALVKAGVRRHDAPVEVGSPHGLHGAPAETMGRYSTPAEAMNPYNTPVETRDRHSSIPDGEDALFAKHLHSTAAKNNYEAFGGSSVPQNSQRALTLDELARMAQAGNARPSGEASHMGE